VDLALTEEQQQLIEAFDGLFSRSATSELVRAAEPLGFDKALRDRLQDMGVVAMAVDESAGGWGATPVDLALVAELVGRFVVPVPVIEMQVAARLLAKVGAKAPLQAALDGSRIVTVALHPVSTGRVGMVPAAAVADDVIVLDGDQLLLVAAEGSRQPVENLGSMPVADVAVGDSAQVLATGPDAVAAFQAAVDDFLCLTAAALVGMGARALEIGVDYVKERKAWGRPIGSFQSVAHRLADAHTAIEGARLLAREAAWAQSDDTSRARELAAFGFAFASEAAREATYRALHYHGGYGFMNEYDAQLYWRRARAWPGVYGEPRLAYARGERARLVRLGKVS
jgi:alkylation response protein AidB-like acyl-CoA dehydrogenase